MTIDLSDYERGGPLAGDYSYELKDLQDRLARLQARMIVHGKRAILLLEGWDAAGKGGIVKRLTAGLDPRYFEVYPIAAPTPEELFEKLDDWGHDSIVIPHGTAWGIYTPAGSDWRKQLPGHDPERQTLVEIYSGHGNSEQLPRWRPVDVAADGSLSCPAQSTTVSQAISSGLPSRVMCRPASSMRS